MSLDVTFRHTPASDALREHLAERVERIQKHVQKRMETRAVLQVDKHEHRVEISVHADGFHAHAEEISNDMYSSIDKATERIDQQLRKQIDKATSHRGNAT